MPSRARRCWILLLLLALALAGAGHAHAQQRDPREVHAQELFALGQYAEALEIYGKLYASWLEQTR